MCVDSRSLECVAGTGKLWYECKFFLLASDAAVEGPLRYAQVKLKHLTFGQVVVFEHPGQIRAGYCPAIAVHTTQARGKSGKVCKFSLVAFHHPWIACGCPMHARTGDIHLSQNKQMSAVFPNPRNPEFDKAPFGLLH